LRYRVVTSFGPAGWELYGENFVKSYYRYWPSEIPLICAWEGQAPARHINGFDLLECEPARAFIERHKDDPRISGKAEHPNWPWGQKWIKKGYNYKFDALKFARKVFAIGAASRYMEQGKLFWIDADVRTHADVPAQLLEALLPDSASVCYLPRENWQHSECGFVGFNLDRIEARAFLTEFEDMYATDRFITECPCWHDSFVFDWLMEKRKPAACHIHNTSIAQPFDHSILGRYMTHLKGARKTGREGWKHNTAA
jgi:hypothetical protein